MPTVMVRQMDDSTVIVYEMYASSAGTNDANFDVQVRMYLFDTQSEAHEYLRMRRFFHVTHETVHFGTFTD